MGVERAALPGLLRLLKMMLVMATTGENSLKGYSQSDILGVASFALRMNKGNRRENIQPFRIIEPLSSETSASVNPKPRKYDQLVSMYVSRLCNSHPMLYHLYSKAYSEQSRLICIIYRMALTYGSGMGRYFTMVACSRKSTSTNKLINISAIIMLMLDIS